jgi:pyruvate/2-oxoglutarate dehydrogenase complex dihydrolipoamide dehydrogenase (E3) component
LDEVAYLTNETIFDNTRKMGHLIIVGGGPIGMEMAQAHHRLGCQVTVIEGERALGKDDPELAGIVLENLRNEGIVIHEGAQVSQVSKKGKTGVRVTCQTNGSETVVEGTHLLIATGRVSNTKNLGLEDAGIDHDRKGIKVRSDLRTSNRRVYAIGDVIGGLQFTHVANYHAGLVIRSILFRLSAKPDNNQIPWVTYTEPELGQVGLTEAQAREKHGSRIQVLRWPYEENDRAQAERKTQGLIKMVADRKGRILGVSIAGAQAGEMMNTWSLAISQGMKVRDVTGYVSPYPTLTEIGKRAAISSYAPMARSGWVRWLIGILRKFG